MSDTRLTAPERRAAFSLASLIGFRMLGLFMLLPVMATYGPALDGYTAAMAGLAMGIYGLTQATLQIPMGRLSDLYGRKRVITAGFLLFAGGALVAALSTHIWGVIIGRAMQGAGAVSAAVLAFAADLTPEHRRSKVMAVIGMTIGASFMVAFVAGPALAAVWGLKGIFWTTLALAVFGLFILHAVAPAEPPRAAHADGDALWKVFFGLLGNGQLMRLAASIFMVHLIMTALFLVLPLRLVSLDIVAGKQSLVYLPTLLGGALLMVPFLILAERRHWQRPLMLVAIVLLAVALLLVPHAGLPQLMLALFLYFLAFNWLEASIPSWASRVVPASAKGSALGLYSSAQFLGAFAGGAGAGLVHQHIGADAVLYAAAGLCGLWLLIAYGLRAPAVWTELQLPVSADEVSGLLARLDALDGVSDVLHLPEQQSVRLRYDKRRHQPEQLSRLLQR